MLGTHVDDDNREALELEQAQLKRNRAAEAWSDAYQGAATTVEGLYRAAGRAELADKVRPTLPKCGAKGALDPEVFLRRRFVAALLTALDFHRYGAEMLQVLDSDEEFLIGTRSNVIVSFWGRTTVERIERVTAVYEMLAERFEKTGFGGISVVLPRRANQELPGVEEARKKLDALVAPRIIAGATVIEGDGMIATATRATYNAIEKLRPGKHPQKLFGSIDEAVLWLLPLCTARSGETLSAKDLAWDIVAARGIRR